MSSSSSGSDFLVLLGHVGRVRLVGQLEVFLILVVVLVLARQRFVLLDGVFDRYLGVLRWIPG